MANPQKEEGYTAIANEIMDALCRIRIRGEEMQVLNVILRKTYGWKKCEDTIALSKFVEMTGMKKPNIVRAISGLLSKMIIIVIKNDNAPAHVYKFNKDYDKWVPLSKGITLSKVITSVIKSDNPSLSKVIPTKETTTKAKKEIYAADFLTFWESYPKKTGSKKAAWDNWAKQNGDRPDIGIILSAISAQIQWRKNAREGEFRPEWKDPERWIKGKMWEAEITPGMSVKEEAFKDCV